MKNLQAFVKVHKALARLQSRDCPFKSTCQRHLHTFLLFEGLMECSCNLMYICGHTWSTGTQNHHHMTGTEFKTSHMLSIHCDTKLTHHIQDQGLVWLQ